MVRSTRQTNSTIKALTFGDNAPSTTSFVRQQFSKSVQTPLVRPGFDAVVHSMRLTFPLFFQNIRLLVISLLTTFRHMFMVLLLVNFFPPAKLNYSQMILTLR